MIETARLSLRLPEPKDATSIAHFYSHNRDHLQPWSPLWTDSLFSEEFWRNQVRRFKEEFDAGLSARLFVFKKGEALLIGTASLTQIQRGPLHSAVLGYALAASEQGQGYMTEAVKAAVEFAFERLSLHRVEAGYQPHNRRSAEVLKRAGFSVEGYARDFLLINGRWEDHILTAITNPRWRG